MKGDRLTKGASVKKVQLDRQENIQKQVDRDGCLTCKGTGRNLGYTNFRHFERPECPCCNGTGKRQPDNPSCKPIVKDFSPRHVEITGTDSPAKWYANKIGKVFEVIPYEDRWKALNPLGLEGHVFLNFLIDTKDCKEVIL